MHHIVLLPREKYWQWVSATQDYVLKFGANLTPDPQTAGEHFYPGQTITIVSPAGGYPLQGDIQSWYEENYPDANLDIVDIQDPAELREVLAERVENGDRVGAVSSRTRIWQADWFADAPIKLRWPTDYAYITQPFGVNPEIYAYWGLPGHEGIDIRAPHNSNIYACAQGEVYEVHDRIDDSHPYGRHIRILHADGYKTIYAHLAAVKVKKGEKVAAGKVIGKADSTGNSSGSHLHLTLKREGATRGGYTHFPRDVLDPTPFLVYPGQEQNSAAYPWSAGRCLAGVNARPDGAFHQTDFKVIQQSGVEAVKLAPATTQADIARLKQINPGLFMMTRAHLPFEGRAMDAKTWVAALRPRLTRHYEAGVRYFELHRAPNLYSEGCYLAWSSGGEFARWWLDAAGRLRDEFPEGRFGFPAVMPGGQVEGQRMDAATFLESCDEAILDADWLGVNAYWSSEYEMSAEENGAFHKLMRRTYPDKLLFVTEFGNVNALTNAAVKGREYRAFYEAMRPAAGIGAAFAQILSSPGPYQQLAWRAEDGSISELVAEIVPQPA